jgi:DNA-binding MarR family transcriptional regulator
LPVARRWVEEKQELGPVLEFMQRLWALDHGLQMVSKRMESQLGITGPQRLVVRIVAKAPGISASELAATLRLHRSTLTGILRRLEHRQVLERRDDPRDLRRARFFLTPDGERINRARSGTVEGVVEHVMAQLSKRELRELEMGLDKVVAALFKKSGLEPRENWSPHAIANSGR